MEYKGLIARDGDDCYLFFEISKGKFSDGIPLTDSQKIYVNLLPSQLNCCKVQFCDGTEPMPFESFENLEDIFFNLKDIAVLSLRTGEGLEGNALQALKESGDEIMTVFFEDEIFD
jgi:hypothetical protein